VVATRVSVTGTRDKSSHDTTPGYARLAGKMVHVDAVLIRYKRKTLLFRRNGTTDKIEQGLGRSVLYANCSR